MRSVYDRSERDKAYYKSAQADGVWITASPVHCKLKKSVFIFFLKSYFRCLVVGFNFVTPIINFDRSLANFKGSFGLTDEFQVINKMKRCHATPEIYDFSLLCKNVHEVID